MTCLMYRKESISTLFFFSDGTSICYESGNLTKLVKNCKYSTQLCQRWFDAKQLSLHVEKTNFMIFHSIRHRIDWEKGHSKS